MSFFTYCLRRFRHLKTQWNKVNSNEMAEEARTIVVWLQLVSPASSVSILSHRHIELLTGPLISWLYHCLACPPCPPFNSATPSSLIPEIGSLFTLSISAEVTLCVLSTKNKPSYMWSFSFFVSLPPREHSLGTLTHILTLVFRLIPSTWNFLTKAHQLIEYIWDSFVSSNTASFLQNQITEKTQIECNWDGLGW